MIGGFKVWGVIWCLKIMDRCREEVRILLAWWCASFFALKKETETGLIESLLKC